MERVPLAERRMQPKSLDEVVDKGSCSATAGCAPNRGAGRTGQFDFWECAGFAGKTTLARIIAHEVNAGIY